MGDTLTKLSLAGSELTLQGKDNGVATGEVEIAMSEIGCQFLGERSGCGGKSLEGKIGEEEFSLAENKRIVECCVDYGAGGTFEEFASVDEKRN